MATALGNLRRTVPGEGPLNLCSLYGVLVPAFSPCLHAWLLPAIIVHDIFCWGNPVHIPSPFCNSKKKITNIPQVRWQQGKPAFSLSRLVEILGPFFELRFAPQCRTHSIRKETRQDAPLLTKDSPTHVR